MSSDRVTDANPRRCDLDQALWQAWLNVQDKVLGHEIELRRRLDRREKMYDHVPRPLCLAIRASDRRIEIAPIPSPSGEGQRRALPEQASTTDHATPHTTNPIRKGHETAHDVLLDAHTIKRLCRPVELYWGQEFRELSRKLGAPRQVPRRLEKRNLIRVRRIPLLAGRRGLPVPLVDSPVPAMAPPDKCEWEHYGYSTLLDPSAWGYTAPDKLLLPYWQHLSQRLPDWFAQTLRRKPIFRVQRRCLRFVYWVWLCPECQREVNTVYLPLGAPDFAQIHNIKLRHAGRHDIPEPHLCFACQRCHHLFGLARTPKSINKSWSLLVAHMSGGLLFGREVQRPASFAALRANKPLTTSRPSPRRDELEAYLAQTDLSLKEIARRMGWTCPSITRELHHICQKRNLPATRQALHQWWTQHRTLAA